VSKCALYVNFCVSSVCVSVCVSNIMCLLCIKYNVFTVYQVQCVNVNTLDLIHIHSSILCVSSTMCRENNASSVDYVQVYVNAPYM
jgi:hypothetical protein